MVLEVETVDKEEGKEKFRVDKKRGNDLNATPEEEETTTLY